MADETSRLLWQCRRGIKEVEVILVPYLQRHYPALDAAGRQRFEALLRHADADLFEWFTGRGEPRDVGDCDMVRTILQQLASDATPYAE